MVKRPKYRSVEMKCAVTPMYWSDAGLVHMSVVSATDCTSTRAGKMVSALILSYSYGLRADEHVFLDGRVYLGSNACSIS